MESEEVVLWSDRAVRRGTGTTADPPFDFAQGRLFGDDNQKGNNKSNGKSNAGPSTALLTKFASNDAQDDR